MLLRRASSEPHAHQRRSLLSPGSRIGNTNRGSATETFAPSMYTQPTRGMAGETSTMGATAAAVSRPQTAPRSCIDFIFRRTSSSRNATRESLHLVHPHTTTVVVESEQPVLPQRAGQEAIVEITVPPPLPQVCCGVINTSCLAIPTPPPLPEAPVSQEQEDGAPPTGKADEKKNVPQTVPGTCVVCLSLSEEVVGAGWLHQRSETEDIANDNNTSCDISVCLPCLKTYFEGIVTSGFDGACPRMRCMCCPRVVCVQAWAPLVDAEVIVTFRSRAATLLSLQCGNCHERGTIMVVPPVDHSYSSALDTVMTNVAESVDRHLKDDDKVTRDSKKEAFRTELVRYLTGEDADVAKFYDKVEPVIALGEEEERYNRMVDVLLCVEDNERRAGLHVRFLRFHPMIKTACCDTLHCFRCRTAHGHPNLTCEEFEASRGHQDVLSCPGCGVYVVKGDGCSSITCVCGENFDWSDLISQRNDQSAEAFRVAHPEDTARAAVDIVRRGPPAAIADLGDAVSDESAIDDEIEDEDEQQASGDESEAAEQHEEGETSVPTIQEPIQEPVPAPLLLVPGSEEEFRLANRFVDAFPREIDQVRAAIYGEENPHFTAELATSQVNGWNALEAPTANLFGGQQPRQFTSTNNSATEHRELERTAAYNWLQHNLAAASEMSRRESDARFALVETFYGGSNSTATIAYVAAEHARAALRLVRAAGRQGGLFSWLGLTEKVYGEDDMDLWENYPSDEAGQGDDAVHASWEAPFARASMDGEPVIPAPAVLWGSRPPRDFVPPRPTGPLEPLTRFVSATEEFGMHRMGFLVADWMDSSNSRQAQLRCLMAREEGRLSEAWVALWGRRGHVTTEGMVRGGGRGKGEAGVQGAARRVAFLEAYPEHACREQSAMMKAFVRRNYAAVEGARKDAVAQRAAAWERMHSSRRSGCSGDTDNSNRSGGDKESPAGSSGGENDVCVFEDALTAYKAHFTRSATSAAESGRRRGSPRDKPREKATFDILANAWVLHNRPRLTARRFGDTHSEEAATVAVVALTVMPMLTGHPSSGCDCGLEPVAREAEEWVKFNAAEFERAVNGMEVCIARDGRWVLLTACECKESGACRRLVGCPVTARRMLKIAECQCFGEDPLSDGFTLDDLFS